MRTFRVGFDFHGLVVNVQLLKQKIIWSRFSRWINDPNLIKREIIVDQLHILTHMQYTAVLNEMYRDPRTLLAAPPHLGVLDTIFRHLLKGDHVYIITASGDAAFQSCIVWCEHHRLHSSVVEVFGSGLNGSKVEIAQHLKLDIHVEDELAPLLDLRNAKAVPHLIRMDRAYERHVPRPKGIRVVSGFPHYEEVVRKLRQT